MEVFASKESPNRNALESALIGSGETIVRFLADLPQENPNVEGSGRGGSHTSPLAYLMKVIIAGASS